MKPLILILIIAAFLQTTILPVDLVLMILVLRAYIVREKGDLYLAFGMGLLISHLNNMPLGIQSIVYLILVELAQIVSRLPISASIFTVIPLILFTSTINIAVGAFMAGSSMQIFPQLIIDTILAIPLYVLIRFWEERFVVKPEIKLKV